MAAMSSTTQILFNSPALHSLKREQLVKLCKVHSIKATGKNVDLIQKLKQHALTLAQEPPFGDSMDTDDVSLSDVYHKRLESEMSNDEQQTTANNVQLMHSDRTRSSEQWEVMDSIQEVDESAASQGTLTSLKTVGRDKSTNEFGTAGSSKSSVSSSLKALATSLGLKRSANASTSSKSLVSSSSNLSPPSTLRDNEVPSEMTKFSTRYSDLPPAVSVPLSDTYTPEAGSSVATDVEMEAPLPGQALRPGAPAPQNARLSLGLGLGGSHTPSKQSQATTTIRLIAKPPQSSSILQNTVSTTTFGEPSTPKLAPFKTSFDLIMSPRIASELGFGNPGPMKSWSSCGTSQIYPTLPLGDAAFSNNECAHSKQTSDDTRGQPSADKSLAPIENDGDVTMLGAFSSPSHDSNTLSSNHPISPPPATSNILKPPSELFIFGSPLPQHRVSDAQFREVATNVLGDMNKRLLAEGVNPVDVDIVNRLHCGTRASSSVQDHRSANDATNTQRGEVKQMFERKHQAEFNKMEGIDALVKRRGMAAKAKNSIEPSQMEIIAIGKKRKSSVLGNEGRRVPSQFAGRASGTRVISNGRRGKIVPEAFDDRDFDEVLAEEGERGTKRTKLEDYDLQPQHYDVGGEEAKRKEKEQAAIRRKLEVNTARRRSSAAAARLSGRVSVGRECHPAQPKQKPSRFGFLSSAKSIMQSVFGRSKVASSTVTAPTASSKAKTDRPAKAELPFGFISSLRSTAPRTLPGTSNHVASTAHTSSGKLEEVCNTTNPRSRSPLPSFGGIALSLPEESGVGSFGGKKAMSREQVYSSSSRLLAPTASSLAKMTGRNTSLSVKPVYEDAKRVDATAGEKKAGALGPITNKPTTRLPQPMTTSGTKLPETMDMSVTKNGDHLVITKTPLQRQGSLNRKPRISRSKVISRLASQRANTVKDSGVVNAGPSGVRKSALVPTSRKRSSLGTRAAKPVGRASHTGGANGGRDVSLLMSAKKRARQSEYTARRQSRVGATPTSKDQP
ncbi:hypothetical protein AMATHDRAFT_83795 [Amanita thiersii Skay4041]|uniref:SAP domain-containing protein n=1 Tax=Amanita thiersii Skay4041 TaxID=703135 RepID=A0A2A9NSF6_9AGAR|nr:hypothetical protein AMATHDRAFT_83795 [Amanita thiersii Skay4041]